MQRIIPLLEPSVLVVESNAVIGIDIAEYLEAEGYTVAGPFACAGAIQWLGTRTPQAALLDVDLRSGICVDMARELRRRGVPTLVFSAHDQRFALPEFQHMPWVPLPSSSAAIGRTLINVLCTGRATA